MASSRISHVRPYWFLSALILVLFASPDFASAQDEDEEGIFWGEEEEGFGDEDFFGDDEELFGDDEEFFDEAEEGEFEEEGFGDDEEFFDEAEEGEFDEFLEEEEEAADEEDESGVGLAREAEQEGFTIQLSAASPGYVNSTLMTWNSFLDFRVGLELPFIMQLGPIKFRLGLEVGSFKFENYLPVGGVFKGVSAAAVLSFPAGPSRVKVGVGIAGSSPSFVVSQSFGIPVGESLIMRIGVRSTAAANPPPELKTYGAMAAWLDGFVAVAYTLQ